MGRATPNLIWQVDELYSVKDDRSWLFHAFLATLRTSQVG